MAFATLHHALVQCLRVMGPVTPFMADEMWENLVAHACGPDAPASVHLAGYPAVDASRIAAGLLAPMADVRAIAELGHRARAEAKLRLRQPLASAVVGTRDAARLEALTSSGLLGEIASELNVKTVTTTVDLDSLVEQQVVPNFRALGPRLGAKVQVVRAALAGGEDELGDDGVVRSRASNSGSASTSCARARARASRRRPTGRWWSRSTPASPRSSRSRERARRRALPPERAQGARLRHLRSHRGAPRRERARGRGAAGAGDSIAHEVLAERFEPGEGGEHRFASGGAEIAFEVARA